MNVRFLLGGVVLAACALAPEAAVARTLVLPHFIERSGRVETTSPTFDTSLMLTYTPGQAGTLAGGGANVDLYLYDNSGQLLRSGGNDVCGPCNFPIGGGAPHKRTIVIDDLITSGGLPFDNPTKLGFGIIVVGGADPDGVAATGVIVNSITGPLDQSRMALPLLALETENPCPLGVKQFVLPHVLERSGVTSNTNNTFDTTIYATYAGGSAGIPDSGGATLDVYLFGDDGAAMTNNGVNVCAPCLFNLSSTQKKLSIRIDDLIVVRGSFDTPEKLGYAIVVVGGADPDRVSLQGIIANSHDGPLDLDLSAAHAMTVPVTMAVGVGTGVPGDARHLGVVPNPSAGALHFSYELARAATVELTIHDASGRRVATVESGVREAGVHQARWDSRDESGRRAAPGIYFGRLSGADGSRVSKVVVLP
ncbi:MAG: FlgD immunoglobulin-like domain containing protein [Candidatus Eisenbacteria bacterium]